jgi:hypothetical protein
MAPVLSRTATLPPIIIFFFYQQKEEEEDKARQLKFPFLCAVRSSVYEI